MRLVAGVLLPLLALLLLIPTAPARANTCQFVLGFQALHDHLPNEVGDCLVDVHYAANGDAVQETTGPTGAGGLLVWRHADNWTAFTDGYQTWINGPSGIQERLNSQRFPWESDFAQFVAAMATANGSPATSSGSSTSSTSSNVSSSTTSNLAVTSVQSSQSGQTAKITIQTTPGASCSLSVAPDSAGNVPAGLGPQTADSSGNVSWSWQEPPGVTPGKVTVSCPGSTATVGG